MASDRKDSNDYLRRKDFEDFKRNEFSHLVKAVHFLRGQLYVLIPLVLAILGILITILMNR
jgi:hypothetical protein